jgi:hypothetical protein
MANLPPSAAEFVQQTLTTALSGAPHEIAAAFCFGRENVIPQMFGSLVSTIDAAGLDCPRLRYYLERHIEVDGDEHGPLAERLVLLLCEGHVARIRDAERVARAALNARRRLWDGVLGALGPAPGDPQPVGHASAGA